MRYANPRQLCVAAVAVAAVLLAGCGSTPAAEVGREIVGEIALEVAAQSVTGHCNAVTPAWDHCNEKRDTTKKFLRSAHQAMEPVDAGMTTDEVDEAWQEFMRDK